MALRDELVDDSRDGSKIKKRGDLGYEYVCRPTTVAEENARGGHSKSTAPVGGQIPPATYNGGSRN